MKKLLMILLSPFMARHRKVERVKKYRAYRQELFNCLSDLGALPTSSEMDEVERIVKKGLEL